MGCSPSKGSNCGTQGPFRRGRISLPGTEESPGESQHDVPTSWDTTGSADGETKEGKTDGIVQSMLLTPQKNEPSLMELKKDVGSMESLGSQELENNKVVQRKDRHGEKHDSTDKKSGKKTKKNNRVHKPVKKRESEKIVPQEQKVDFPEPLVEAHEAAYAFLNPSITKYDIILGLLEQANQTQVSVQPMVAFMALRYEEVNRGLKEMADEGEKLLKENGKHLAWPSQMKNLSTSPLKPGNADIDPPPDLLQQLLQYTTQRMRNVSHAVGGIADLALEEAVEFFASVSELLEEKLKIKRATEARLMQLLNHIEIASLRKPGPEDSALFSEDSGIGAESESLAGSERHHRRGSSESTGTKRTTSNSSLVDCNTIKIKHAISRRIIKGKVSASVSLDSIDSTCTIMAKEQNDTESLLSSASLDEGYDNDPDGGIDHSKVGARIRSNSSPVDFIRQPRRLPSKRIENPQNVEMTLKMKDAISSRIQFVPSQNASAKTKITDSPKTKHQWTEDDVQSQKRPQTAAPIRRAVVKKTPVVKERRSQSAESLRSKAEDHTLHELQRTQKDLNKRLEKMCKIRTGKNNRTIPSKQNHGSSPARSPAINCIHLKSDNSKPQAAKENASLVKHSNKEPQTMKDAEQGKAKTSKKASTPPPIKATPPPSPPLSPRPSSGLCRGRNSVKKLIDTFSQGREEQVDPKILGPLKGVRKCGVPVLPGLGNVEAVLSTGLTSCRDEATSYEKNEYLDLESLPPPPLEVLMDNSFEGAQGFSACVADGGATKTGRSPATKRAMISHRLRASVQSGTVLPSKGNLPQGSSVMIPAKGEQQDSTTQSKSSQLYVQSDIESKNVAAASLYKQARKIIHLRHSTDSPLEKQSNVNLPLKPSPSQTADDGSTPVPKSNVAMSSVPHTSVASKQPCPTPPTSRVRMLPSTPSTSSNLHQRLTSPHTCRRQPTPPSSTSPPVLRKLPTPPAGQRRLPSPPVVMQNMNSSQASSYSFKAPSTPASPKVQRWSRENSNEDSPFSRLVSNARSVFCPASSSMFEAQPCPVPRPPHAWTSSGISILPRPWGINVRFPAFLRGPQPSIRRSHSERRPSLGLPPRSPCNISMAQMCGSEPAINAHGLANELTRDDDLWSSQSELRATPRSASHPDLCVVGQALH